MKLFEKNEVTFSVVLIVIYVVGSSVMQRVSASLGAEFLAEMIFCLILSGLLIVFIGKNRLGDYLGLKKPWVSAVKMLFYIPLILTAGAGAFFGLGMKYGVGAAVRHTVMMICVGFLEEVIFRGFLFRGIAKSSLTRAVVISSLTFGIGHIVNLLNGMALLENSVQMVFAVAVGFMLVFVFLRTGSIIPCIVFHALNNCLSAFVTGDTLIAKVGETNAVLVLCAVKISVCAAYLVYVMKLPKRELPERK